MKNSTKSNISPINVRVWFVAVLSGAYCIAALQALPVANAMRLANPPDGNADRVLGQTSFSGQSGGLSATRMDGPAGIAIVPTGAPNSGRIFVVEYRNFRVLSWPNAAGFASGDAADLVLGQSDFVSGAGGLEAYKFFGPEAAVVDANGNLYVADTENSRVLQFRPPFSNGMSASVVFGQPNFVTPNNQPNQGGGTAANTLYYPRGLAIDSAGNLFVADAGNHRIVRYAPPFANNMSASLVLGQANLTGGSANQGGGPGQSTLNDPKGVAIDSAGHVYIADYGNHRVLRFDPTLANGMNASKAFGQPSYTAAVANNGGLGAGTLNSPVDLAVTWGGDMLFVTDQGNMRVLGYLNPATSDAEADALYGQPNYTSAAPNNGGVSAASLNQEPLGVAIDALNGLYIADFQNNRVLAFDPPASPTSTATSTATVTPEPTATATATATPTLPAVPSPTPTVPPTSNADGFEQDDDCVAAKAIANDGTIQVHNFHKQADTDWVRFDAIAGTTYIVQGQVGPESPVDLTLEAFASCADVPQSQNYAFSPGVRLEFTAAASGPLYLKWTNANANVFGNAVRYTINVTARSNTPPSGVVIIVAGRLKANDPLQLNIHNMTNAVYAAFTQRGYITPNIQYLAPNTMPGVTGMPTVLNLQNAITTWAKQKLSNNQSLTLYLMDHGDPDLFYLDKTNSQTLTPQMLNGWLNELEGQFTNLNVNVIIDACYSGSFITEPASLSKAGRVVIASTTANSVAFASAHGAIFSDYFVAALAQGQSLFDAFSQARWSTQIAYPLQGPQLDDDGDQRSNTPNDGIRAQQRGFSFAGSFDPDSFAPYIQNAETRPSTQNNRREIRATILDDTKVETAYAVIYPPSYVPPTSQTELASESLENVLLADTGNDTFAALYSGFVERGTYRIVVYARDQKNKPALPVEIFVQLGANVYLPVLTH